MKIIIKEGEKNDSVRKTFECRDCGCIFTSDKYNGCFMIGPNYTFWCTCPWCHSDMAFEKKEG